MYKLQDHGPIYVDIRDTATADHLESTRKRDTSDINYKRWRAKFELDMAACQVRNVVRKRAISKLHCTLGGLLPTRIQLP